MKKAIGLWYRRYLRIGCTGERFRLFEQSSRQAKSRGAVRCRGGDTAADTKVSSIPSSNGAAQFVLAKWSATRPTVIVGPNRSVAESSMSGGGSNASCRNTDEDRTNSYYPAIARLLACHD